jgi:hypothetical protein
MPTSNIVYFVVDGFVRDGIIESYETGYTSRYGIKGNDGSYYETEESNLFTTEEDALFYTFDKAALVQKYLNLKEKYKTLRTRYKNIKKGNEK